MKRSDSEKLTGMVDYTGILPVKDQNALIWWANANRKQMLAAGTPVMTLTMTDPAGGEREVSVHAKAQTHGLFDAAPHVTLNFPDLDRCVTISWERNAKMHNTEGPVVIGRRSFLGDADLADLLRELAAVSQRG